MLRSSGDSGRIALFISQLPKLFEAYQLYGSEQKVDKLLVLHQSDGFSSAVNRGPAAMVGFLQQLEAGFGISIRDLLSVSPTAPVEARATVAPGASVKGYGAKEA